MRQLKLFALPSLIVLAVVGIVAWAAHSPVGHRPESLKIQPNVAVEPAVAEVDALFASRWEALGLEPAERADDLQILRRLSLVLHGTISSLEEIRSFESDRRPDRLRHWIARMLSDVRFADYFAERLARNYVGVEGGQFVVFRRDRFVDWLSGELREGRPYDEIVRAIISEQGLWTGRPAANFVTAAVADDNLDVNKLAGRTVRAFLGQRIDCAQCHDHPFDHWRQEDFEGLAAFFGQAKLSVVGVEDDREKTYEVEDRLTLETREVEPQVPFHTEWIDSAKEEETLRQRLAEWVTHPENRRFERAIANRVWGLMFGRPYLAPVDDLPDPPPADAPPDLLDILGADFREHGYDLRRLIFVIASSRPFQLDSQHPALDTGHGLETLEQAWAVFPLTRLRPEQVIGAMLQASYVKTIDQNSHLFTRAIRFFQEINFVKEYGDLGENELEDHAGTIPQALLRLNGRMTRERSEAGPFSAAGRIAAMAPDDESCLDTCYLCCLGRRPTAEEREHFLEQLRGKRGDRRSNVVEDVYWVLFNSPEFSWNH